MPQPYLLDRIAIILAGRAAEKIKYGDVSTGAGDDLKKATQLAEALLEHETLSREEIDAVLQEAGLTN